jgi:hypothetical protein
MENTKVAIQSNFDGKANQLVLETNRELLLAAAART